MRTWAAVGLIPLISIAASCGGDAVACATADCSDGLSVTITNPPAEAYRVEATPAGATTPQVQTCNGGSCLVGFPGLVSNSVTIQVVLTASGTVVRSANIAPTYSKVQPNGADCGPTCIGASVTV